MLFSRLLSTPTWLCITMLTLASLLPSCTTPESYGYGSSERYVPAVRIPRNLDENEQRFIYDVETTLTNAGYRLSNNRSAEYELDFRIEAGPVNTDTYLTLRRDNGREVASAYARSTGLLNRQQIIRQSFEKCLIEFERLLPDVSSGSYDPDYRSDTYHNRRSPSPYRY